MKGIWTEAVIEGAPEFLGAESSFTKMSITHRQYFTIIKDDLSFAYRLNYQTSIGGHTPFYYQTQVLVSELKGASSEGLGGGSTMRGISRNRVMGDGYFLGNVEARWKFVRFRFINNNFYLGLNGFMVKLFISEVFEPKFFFWIFVWGLIFIFIFFSRESCEQKNFI